MRDPELFLREVTFQSPEWDYLPHIERKQIIAHLFRRQFEFMKERVPFYAKRYAKVNSSDLQTYEDCAEHVPSLRKTEIRDLPSPFDLLPSGFLASKNFFLHRGTGGTTGRPTSMFYSYNDWKAIVDGMVRPLKGELDDFRRPVVAFDSYNQGHISGPIFDDTVRAIGGVPICRTFGSKDGDALKQMQYHRCNLLIGPAVSTHKGGSIETLLEADSTLGLNYLDGGYITTIFLSLIHI